MMWTIIAGVLVLIPITSILTEHQRKLAEIRGRAGGKDADRMEALESRVAELTELVHQQTIAVDNLAGRVQPERVEQRLRG